MYGTLRPLIRPSAIVLAALALLASDARAAGLKAVIITQPPNKPGIIPVGDPVYIYNFAAYLQPGYALHLGDSIVLKNLLGAPLVTGTYAPDYAGEVGPLDGAGWTISHKLSTPSSGPWPTSWIPNDPPPTVPITDITFKFVPGDAGPVSVPDDPGATPLFLGIFQVYTELLPDLGDYSMTFAYEIHAHTIGGARYDQTGDTVTLSTAVPEPCTFLLLGLGAAAPLAWSARRRRAA